MKSLEINNLTKRYGEKAVVDGLSLEVEHGTCLALLGPNGAGKTTTIKMICGLVRPTEGSVHLMEHPVTKRAQVMPHLGVVLEGARNVHWRMSPLNNLRYFANLKGLRATSAINKRMEQLLNDLDLWDRRHDEVRTFSRGMQQKVAIACALIADPNVVLLDEPTLGLDVQAYSAILGFVRELSKTGKTVVVTSHDFDFIGEIAERVVVMKQHLIFDGTPQDLAAHHGATHRLHISDAPDDLATHVPDWTIKPVGKHITVTGAGDIYAMIAKLGDLGCTLHEVEEITLTADVFLDLIGEQRA